MKKRIALFTILLLLTTPVILGTASALVLLTLVPVLWIIPIAVPLSVLMLMAMCELYPIMQKIEQWGES